jgi:large subunit ribosomal protein L10
MVSKQKKQEIVAELVEKFKKANGVYVVDFTRMTVAETFKFRKTVRAKDLEYRVAKNTLIKRAMKEVGGFNIPDANMFGQSGLILGYDDPTTPAKMLKEFSAKGGKPVLKAAFLDGQFFDGSELETVASLPTRADLISGIIGSIGAPASGIVGAINAVMRDLASVIEEVAKKKSDAA